MFTGIVESVGTVTAADMAEDDGMLLAIDSEQMDLRGLRVGHSVAVNGVCLTVIKIFRGSIFFDVSPETLSISLPLMVGEQVNLEKALSVGGHMGGHYVSGHVDSTVEVKSIKNHGENKEVFLQFDIAQACYFVAKGSVTLNGVSLTVNTTREDEFSVNLIPHTLRTTNLNAISVGSFLNLEIDMLARYVQRALRLEGGYSE